MIPLKASQRGEEIGQEAKDSLSYITLPSGSSSFSPTSDKPVIWVLSVDGGGVRGIIPSLLLAHLETVTGRPAADMFKVMGGTSTGSIITAALNIPGEDGRPKYSAEEIVALYRHESFRIFYRSWYDVLFNPFGFKGPYYNNIGLKSALSTYFEDSRLCDSINPILIPAWDITRRKPLIFNSKRARESSDSDFPTRKIVQGSCSAPVYFKPTRLRISDQEKINVMDGAFWAISPARLVLEEARKLYPDADIRVISLGCGETIECLSHKDINRLGLLGWVLPAINNFAVGQAEEVDLWMNRELNEGSPFRRYYRIQTNIDLSHRDLDNSSHSNLRYLEKKAQEIIENDPVFGKLVFELKKQSWPHKVGQDADL